MARLKVTIDEKDSIEVKGDGEFVQRVLGCISPLLEAKVISVAVTEPETVKAALDELELAMNALESDKNFSGTYWKHTIEK